MEEKKAGVNSIIRAISLLKTLAEGGEKGGTELAEQVKLHKSTVSRLLSTLAGEGFVEKNPENGKYRLGLTLFELGMAYSSQLDLRTQAHPYLKRIMEETGEVAHLGILHGTEVVYLDKVESNYSLSMISRIGARVSVHSTAMGKAMLAYMKEEKKNGLLQALDFKVYTENTLKTELHLEEELEEIRKRGYAVDEEENEQGIRCVGVPVLDYTGEVAAAISVSGPTVRIIKEKVPHIAATLMQASQELSRSMGWQGSIAE